MGHSHGHDKDTTWIQRAVRDKNEGALAGQNGGPGGPTSVVVVAGNFSSCGTSRGKIFITLDVPGFNFGDLERLRSALEKSERVIVSVL